MPILNTNLYGAGTLYTLADADPHAYLTQPTVYYQTALFNAAVRMTASNADFIIAGAIASNYIGISVEGSGVASISLTSTGYLSGDDRAINIYEDQGFALHNAGLIESTKGVAVSTPGSETHLSTTRINNSGKIIGGGYTAVELGAGDDRIINTGTIVGDVRLGAGQDTFNTVAGVFVGQVYGGSGNDIYYVGKDTEIFEFLNEGTDTVFSAFDYELPHDVENLYLRSGAHDGAGNELDNYIQGNNAANELYGFQGKDTLYGRAGNDRLFGGDGDDVIDGGAGNNFLSGDDGKDYLSVDGGTNILLGGGGDDTLLGGLGDDVLNGGSGNDIASLFSLVSGITADLTAGTVSGGNSDGDTLIGIESISATNFDNTLTGNAAANTFYTGLGNDVLSGLDGDDTFVAGAGSDTIDGGAGNDTIDYLSSLVAVNVNLATLALTGGDAAGDTLTSIENATGSAFGDTLTGSAGDNVLKGREGNDSLTGGNGNDTLYGGAGEDLLYGGGNRDIFGYEDVLAGVAGGWGADTIKLFQNGIDKISFVGASGILSMADLTIATIGADVFVTTAGGDSIRLQNFSAALLDVTDFIFAI